MTRLRGSWVAMAAACLFLLTACARTGGQAGADGAGDDPKNPEPPVLRTDALVLRIERFGGFMSKAAQVGRMPLISVYADGRVITQGPTTMQYPPNAWPNVQVEQTTTTAVDDLVAKAGAAGVGSGADLGRPVVADAPSTRVIAVVNGAKQVIEVQALNEARSDDPNLTAAQKDARTKLAAFVNEVTGLTGAGKSQAYQPTAVAALSRPYEQPNDGLAAHPTAVAWPGPALAGGCVTVSGAELAAVVAAARDAKSITPWTSGGKQWFVVFRPLLPDEKSCADITAKGE